MAGLPFPTPSSDPAQYAGNGTKQIADTSEHIGPFYHAQVIAACVVNAATTTGFDGSLDGRTYGAGTVFRFQIDSITLDSGEIHAYYKDPGQFIELAQGGDLDQGEGDPIELAP